MRKAKIFDVVVDSLIYLLSMLAACLVCMCAEILLVKIVDVCVAIDYFTLCIIRTVIYTLGVNATLSAIAYRDGYKSAKCSIIGTFISCALASVVHFLFSLLFGFEAFCAGGVRFITGLVQFGTSLSASSMIAGLHLADFVAVFFINSLVYCILMTAFKKVGERRRLIDREQLTGSASSSVEDDKSDN